MTTIFTDEQRRYAATMDPRQRAVFKALVTFPFPLTASERADPLLYALIRRKYAQVVRHTADGVPIWTATDSGRALFKELWPDEWHAIFGPA